MGKLGKSKKKIIAIILLLVLVFGAGLAYGFRKQIARIYAGTTIDSLVDEDPAFLPYMAVDSSGKPTTESRLRSMKNGADGGQGGANPNQVLVPAKNKIEPDMMISGEYSFIPALSSNSRVVSYRLNTGTNTSDVKELSIDPKVDDGVGLPAPSTPAYKSAPTWCVSSDQVNKDKTYLLVTDVGYYKGYTVDMKIIPVAVDEGAKVNVGYKKYTQAELMAAMKAGTNSGVIRDNFLSISATATSEREGIDNGGTTKYGFHPAEVEFEFYIHKNDSNVEANFDPTLGATGLQVNMLMTFVDFDYNEAVGVVKPKQIDRIYTQVDNTNSVTNNPESGNLSPEFHWTNNLYYYYNSTYDPTVKKDDFEDSFWVYRNQRKNNTETQYADKWFSFTINSTNPETNDNKASIALKVAAGYMSSTIVPDSVPPNYNGLKLLPDDSFRFNKDGYFRESSAAWGSAVGFTQQSLLPVDYPVPIKTTLDVNAKESSADKNKVDLSTARNEKDNTVTFKIAQVSPSRTINEAGTEGSLAENGEPQLIFEDVLDPAFEVDTKADGTKAIWIVDRQNPDIDLLTSAPDKDGKLEILFDDYNGNPVTKGTRYAAEKDCDVVRIRAKGDDYAKDTGKESLLKKPEYKDYYYSKVFFIYIRVKLKDNVDLSEKGTYPKRTTDQSIFNPDSDGKLKPLIPEEDAGSPTSLTVIDRQIETNSDGTLSVRIPNQARTIVTNPVINDENNPLKPYSATDRVLYSDVSYATFTWDSKLRIKKVDADKETVGLQGATFDVDRITDSGLESVAKGVKTGADGTYTLDNIPAGEYQVTEIAPPPGYTITETKKTQKITMYNVSDDNLDAVTITFKDKKAVNGELSVSKDSINGSGQIISNGSVKRGEIFTYKIVIKNTKDVENSQLENVTLSDAFDQTRLTYVSGSTVIDGTAVAAADEATYWSGNTLSYTHPAPGTLGPNQQVTIEFNVKVKDSAKTTPTDLIVNTAEATADVWTWAEDTGIASKTTEKKSASVENSVTMGKNLYLRTCILNGSTFSDYLVIPTKGYLTLYNRNASATNAKNGIMNATVTSSNGKVDNLAASDFTKYMVMPVDTYDFFLVKPVVPELYYYEGYAISDKPEDNHTKHISIDATNKEAVVDFSSTQPLDEQYVTIYFTHAIPDKSKPEETVPFYDWDYRLNSFTKITK